MSSRDPLYGVGSQIGADAVNPVHPVDTSVFDLPDRLAAKADPRLVAADEAFFTDLAANLERAVSALSARLAAELAAPGGSGQHAQERDQEVRRLSGRLRALRRFGADLCLGHVLRAGDPHPTYVGRLGLTDDDGRRLLVDWRSPAAEPFFGATHADPMGLVRRRRYRWTGGRVTDYWDEVFTADAPAQPAALDDRSAFLASLAGHRSARMRDVLGTIAADQDAVIRAGSSGALVVDGGPGTGKTVVALHRAAYLLYSDPRLRGHRGGVLVVGPHQPYLDYVADVLPSLGEEGVRTCTLRDLVAEGAGAGVEPDLHVAQLKASADLATAVEAAVRFHEQPPSTTSVVDTPWVDVRVRPADWAEAFAVPDPGTPHNEARDPVWEELLTLLVERHDGDAPAAPLRATLADDHGLRSAFGAAWPLVGAADLVGDLWSVPAYLRHCAPWLSRDDVRTLQRGDPTAWTVSDLPWLDAARARLGDPAASQRRRRHAARVAAEREGRDRVVEDLIAADDSELLLMSMLRGRDAQNVLVDEAALGSTDPDRLAGPFAHVVVDEAQELTDAEWQMVRQRCPSGSVTVVGDRAQARHGFPESWSHRLERVGLGRVTVATLRVNYRTPTEIMAEAEPVIRAVLPDATVPVSIRDTGIPVSHGDLTDLDGVLATWLAGHGEGTACVIGYPAFRPRARVRSLTPELAKGLEFDLVVVVDPARFGDDTRGGVDRYVAMTRATEQLVVLTGG